MKEAKVVWWMVLLQGLALLLFGIFAVAWPSLTFIIFSYLFALYVLTAGVVNTVYGISGISRRRGWFLSLALGIVELAVSVYVLKTPFLTLAAFAAVLGITIIFQGIMGIIISFVDLTIGTRVLDIVGGVLGIIAGFFILRYPLTGGIAYAWVIGIYGLVAGAIRIAIALSAFPEIEKVSSSRVASAKR